MARRATITNRPDKQRNRPAMISGCKPALAISEKRVRVVIMAANGPAFCWHGSDMPRPSPQSPQGKIRKTATHG
jgi:hypothetical protein